MTPEERQALREKHTPKFLGAYEDGPKCCPECHDNDDYARCALCIDYINNDGPYPCSVAVLLRALELTEEESTRREFEVDYALGILKDMFKGLPVNGLGRAIQVLEQGAYKEEIK